MNDAKPIKTNNAIFPIGEDCEQADDIFFHLFGSILSLTKTSFPAHKK